MHVKRPNSSLYEPNKQPEEHFQAINTTSNNNNHQQQISLLQNLKPTIEQQEHPHNRIQLRQTILSDAKQSIFDKKDQNDYLPSMPRLNRQYRNSVRFEEFSKANEQNLPANQIENLQLAQPESSSSKTTVGVKLSAINSYTYKLKLSILKMQPEDYGEYSCISSNSMGNSESLITVTSKSNWFI